MANEATDRSATGARARTRVYVPKVSTVEVSILIQRRTVPGGSELANPVLDGFLTLRARQPS
jgi:hypothetical protein